MSTSSDIETIVCSGAGYDIIYEMGICAEMQKAYNLKTFIGTSAGSITCLALALGWNINELIIKVIAAVNGKKVYNNNLFSSLIKLPFSGYLFDSDIRTVILDIILSKVTNDSNSIVTFSSPLFADKTLIILANEYTTGQPVVFSRANTPDADVRLAAMASSSIPIAFKPQQMSKQLVLNLNQEAAIPDTMQLIDGTITAFYPINYTPDINKTVGICISSPAGVSRFSSFGSIKLKLVIELVHIYNLLINISGRSMILSDAQLAHTMNFIVPHDSMIDYFEKLETAKMYSMVDYGRQAAINYLKS